MEENICVDGFDSTLIPVSLQIFFATLFTVVGMEICIIIFVYFRWKYSLVILQEGRDHKMPYR